MRRSVFVLLLALASVVLGCGGGGGGGGPTSTASSRFVGSWVGTWTSAGTGQTGVAEITIDTGGSVTGTIRGSISDVGAINYYYDYQSLEYVGNGTLTVVNGHLIGSPDVRGPSGSHLVEVGKDTFDLTKL